MFHYLKSDRHRPVTHKRPLAGLVEAIHQSLGPGFAFLDHSFHRGFYTFSPVFPAAIAAEGPLFRTLPVVFTILCSTSLRAQFTSIPLLIHRSSGRNFFDLFKSVHGGSMISMGDSFIRPINSEIIRSYRWLGQSCSKSSSEFSDLSSPL